MLTLTIPDTEWFNEDTLQFVYVKGGTIQLEHSLLSISKWESKWHKPFISEEKRTEEENIDYVRCMTVTQNVPDKLYSYFTIPGSGAELLSKVYDYIKDPMTATHFLKKDSGRNVNGEPMTSEYIYYMMFSFGIDKTCEKWHLNRLLTLIKLMSLKQEKPKKMSKNDIMRQNSALNAARRAKHHSRG